MPEKTIYPKTTCCISGCPRWSRQFAPGGEWICGRHWRLIRKSRRLAMKKLWRWLDAIDRPGGVYVEPTFEKWQDRRKYKMRRWKAGLLWKGAIREATLKAAGI